MATRKCTLCDPLSGNDIQWGEKGGMTKTKRKKAKKKCIINFTDENRG